MVTHSTDGATARFPVRPPASGPATVRLDDPAKLAEALREFGIPVPMPVLVLVGGAGGLSKADADVLSPVFDSVVVPLLAQTNAAVVDGGTDAGVMRLIGRARAKVGASFPVIGVVVESLVRRRGDAAGDARSPVEPNHTHVMLVPGSDWGDEAEWLASTASAVASRTAGSVTLLINGGEIAYRDIQFSVAQGRVVVTLSGSGRTADGLGAAVRGEPADDLLVKFANSGMVRDVSLSDPVALHNILTAELTTGFTSTSSDSSR